MDTIEELEEYVKIIQEQIVVIVSESLKLLKSRQTLEKQLTGAQAKLIELYRMQQK